VELNRIVILADESANWQIAGLSQLQRLALAINEFAATLGPERKIDIFIFWKPALPAAQRWMPKDPRLMRCEIHVFDDAARAHVACILSTRMVVQRGALAGLISIVPRIESAETAWEELARTLSDVCRSPNTGWRCLNQLDDIPETERWLLRNSGKTQDGFVSRLLNRPVSRSISRLVLKTSITPNAWTLSIFALPIVAFVLLQRGDYIGFVSGAALFQLFSMLDGCDGEVARAKYLESERGRALDTFFDVAGNVLFALGLGLGLQRVHHGWYVAEGILCAAALATNEWLLTDLKAANVAPSDTLGPTFYHRHRTMLQRAGLLFLGEKFLWWIFQLTKRDVALLFFLLLAIAGRAEWVLHLWTAVAGTSLIVSLIARLRGR
jgi:phosphatidylglycerophosphate synthase